MQQGLKKILIVDDNRAHRQLFVALLKDDYRLAEADCGEEAVEKLSVFVPDLVLLDIMMPGIDGHETCRRIKSGLLRDRVQVIMVSARSSGEEQLRAFEAGADDYVVKPFDAHAVRSRVHLHFQLQDAMAKVESVKAKIESRNSELNRLSEQRTEEVMATQDVAVFTLAKVAESRDNETGEHLNRMRCYAQILAEQLAREGPYTEAIDKHFLDDLYRSSPLHDIGKVGISDAILLKPGRLTPDEFKAMEQHTVIGADILDQAVLLSPVGGFLAMAAVIARYHHERFDGSGYPEGLTGQKIPLPARIVAVADVYDALTSVRPYKPAYPALDAIEMILCESTRHFDPVIIDAFEKRFDDLLNVVEQGDRCGPITIPTTALLDLWSADLPDTSLSLSGASP